MHRSVLLKEVIDLLDLRDGDIFLDATLGEGGHSEAIANLEKKVVIAGIDTDPKAVEMSRERVPIGKFAELNFREIDKAPELLGIERPSKILFDLGWSKQQFEESGKGFSFQKDEPLDMRLGNGSEFTTSEILNTWDEENIRTIIESYGEEKFAYRIAQAIVEARKVNAIRTTFELVEVIKKATPAWYHSKKIHPATRTFQALRIAVNDELRALQKGMGMAFEILVGNGRIAVISFHSLEDRIVKRYFKSVEVGEKGKILTKKPIIATKEEIINNPRSRSAKLRVIEKLKD